MLWAVLPAVTAADIVAAVTDVPVANESIVVVDVDAASIITPAASPAASSVSPPRAHGHSDTEGKGQGSRRWIVNRWVGINRCAPNHRRAVRGHIDDLRIRRLDHDYPLAFDALAYHQRVMRGL